MSLNKSIARTNESATDDATKIQLNKKLVNGVKTRDKLQYYFVAIFTGLNMTAIFLTPLLIISTIFLFIFYIKFKIRKRIKLLDSHLDSLSNFLANDWVYSINGYNGLALSDDSLCLLYITTKGLAHHKIIDYTSLVDVKINRIVNLNFTDRVELQLIIDDLSMPTHNVLFFEGHMENKLVDYDSGVQNAIHWHALLTVCQKKAASIR